jgi:hypothetical protein
LRGHQRPDPALPLAPTRGFIAREIIEASAGVGVDHTECCRLPTQVVQDATKDGMLEYIGEITSVEFVVIIHDRNLPTRWPSSAASPAL